MLKNRYLHISYQSDGASVSKGQIGTLSVTLEERAVLNCISQNNRMDRETYYGIAHRKGYLNTQERQTEWLLGREVELVDALDSKSSIP